MRKKFFLIYFFSFIFFFLILSWVVPCQKSGLFEVKPDQNLSQITDNLKKQGFISVKFPFYAYILAKGGDKELKYGVYQFSSKETFFCLAQKIINGLTYTIKITIPEGFTIKQIENRLNQKLTRSVLVNFDASLEGFLFPDTYFFSPLVTIEEIVKIFSDNFDKKLSSDLRTEIEKQNKTVGEIIIMASLIEKEVKTKQDKEIISGILWKRLKINMPLQVDCEPKTYEKPGLPICPICNPGLDSILAAVYPKGSNFWYYLSANNGETIFSRTLEEHNIAKAKYLK